MFYTLGQGPLFRVSSTTAGSVWPDPVRGEGAYYAGREANRFSRPDQLTVYCTEDPLVAVTEGAFYQAMKWQKEIALFRSKAVRYPLVSEQLLWVFRIDPTPDVLDLESELAQTHFGYSSHVLLNPCRQYTGTQEIADDVRAYVPPEGSGQGRPEGLKAPSVRTPYARDFQPYQLALFVRNMPDSDPFEQRSRLIAKMKIEFEFRTPSPVSSVAYEDARIDWANPRFRVSAIPGEPSVSPIPAFSSRPNSRSYHLEKWYRIRVVY